jgi:hypothetical protein
MTLSRSYSGGKPQRGEDRIGGSRRGLPFDPFLNLRQTFRCLMDIVPIGDIGKGLEQLFEACAAIQRWTGDRMAGAASRCAHHRQHSFLASHSRTFPHDFAARILIRPVAG